MKNQATKVIFMKASGHLIELLNYSDFIVVVAFVHKNQGDHGTYVVTMLDFITGNYEIELSQAAKVHLYDCNKCSN